MTTPSNPNDAAAASATTTCPPFSQVPGRPSFRNASLNTIAMVPLLSTDADGKEVEDSHSAASFRLLWSSLSRYAKSLSEQQQQDDDEDSDQQSPAIDPSTMTEVDIGSRQQDIDTADTTIIQPKHDLLVVIPNSQLTRPGDWRYDSTPLKSFHWSNGCQRLLCFDGRHSRLAHDRLFNASVGRDWIDLCPSRRTAAVVGILNVKDCLAKSNDPKVALHQAERELNQWAERYSCPPYEVTAHGRNQARDDVVQRLFVFDSFEEEASGLDLTQTALGSNLVAFPPSDQAHCHMMDLHLNVVLNDLAVAIFCQLETKIRAALPPQKQSSSLSSGPAGWGYNSNYKKSKKQAADDNEPVNSSANLSITQIASVVNPSNQLAASIKEEDSSGGDGTTPKKELAKKTRTAIATMAESAAGKLKQIPNKKGIASAAAPQLLTPLDDVFEFSELSPRDVDAVKKRDAGRREKLAADLSLLAGSPIDAYERYTRAAELTKAAHDPLWYAASLEGCAAAFCAMAEAGGHAVDAYLENNFQLPDDMLALATMKDPEFKKQAVADKTKTTLPAAVFALCEEALSITNRHPKLAPLHAELLLKLVWYTAEQQEGHLQCRWGEGEGCFAGDTSGSDPARWERTSVHTQLNFDYFHTKEGKEFLAQKTLQQCQKWIELSHRAVTTGALDPRSRADVAATCARLCLTGIKPMQWNSTATSTAPPAPPPVQERWTFPRKAAFFTVIAAEALSQCSSDPEDDHGASDILWLAACQSYDQISNTYQQEGSHYGWATLRATMLHALSQQQDPVTSEAAAELLLALLSEVSPDRVAGAGSTLGETDSSLPDSSRHNVEHGEGETAAPADDIRTVTSAFSMRSSVGATNRSFFAPSTTQSLLTVAQSKWTDDDPIAPLPLPLVDPKHVLMVAASGRRDAYENSALDASLSTSPVSLNCVLPKMEPESCALAQKLCIMLISELRQDMPTGSSAPDDVVQTSEPFPIYGSNHCSVPPPLYIVTAKAVKSESHLLLERSKAHGFPGKAGVGGAMSTFFNPYEKKKKQAEKKAQATLVAEGEERSVLVEFGNRLSVPLPIPSCQLEFDIKDGDRIKAPPLSFIVPPKAKKFAVLFPFIVVANKQKAELAEERKEDDDEEESKMAKDVFEVTGLRVTCLTRSFCIPIGMSETKNNKTDDGDPEEDVLDVDKQVPISASTYQRYPHNRSKKLEEQTRPQFETVPPQPHLLVSFITSKTPIDDGTVVPVHLSDGEIFTIPPFRLQNDFGPSGMGTMERLQIVGVGLPGLPDEILYDTDAIAAAREEDELTDTDESESSTEDFEELMESDGLPPLKMKAICEGLSLKSINDKSMTKGSTVMFQIAATHDMGNQLANGGNVRIRYRYRGQSPSPETEVWRKREVNLRIVRIKGPRISSITFRPDLSWGSAYSELCRSLVEQKLRREAVTNTKHQKMTIKNGSTEVQEENADANKEDSALNRVGVDAGVHVSGNDVVVLMAVANETNSTVILSNRKGLVGGFEGSPMPTVRVTSGVSVKIPVVIPRIDRIDEQNEVTDIAAELVARTALQWESEAEKCEIAAANNQFNQSSSTLNTADVANAIKRGSVFQLHSPPSFDGAVNRRIRQGRVRIPSRCLREIIAEHQSFASRICKPPVSVSVKVSAPAHSSENKNQVLLVSPGTPVDTFVEVDTADWVSPDAIANCSMRLEFCCARKGRETNSSTTMDASWEAAAADKAYVWCGRVTRKVRADDADKTHRARLAMLECGTFVVSACVCLSMSGNGVEETWWAPQAENVHVVEKLPSHAP